VNEASACREELADQGLGGRTTRFPRGDPFPKGSSPGRLSKSTDMALQAQVVIRPVRSATTPAVSTVRDRHLAIARRNGDAGR
jgi:hypothetical protein